MIALPTTSGWIVEFETEEVSKRTGNKLWKEVLCTTSKEKAEKKAKELKDKGINVRVLEGIF